MPVPRYTRHVLGFVAVLAGAWTVALYAGYGQSLAIGPVRLSSRNPVRPLLVCAAAAAAYAFVSGAAGLRRDLSRLSRDASRIARTGAAGVGLVEARVNPAAIALLLVAASIGTALGFRESTAGGADAFSYVTQADLWRTRTPGLRTEIPVAAAAPWPDAIWTFTPFGYRPTADRRAVVPVTAPGLSMAMAAFQLVGGHCAMFWVVPLTGGLLVWSTFLIGRELGSDGIGLGAAWLVATSPTFLSMSKWVMSDVPAAAFWALAIALLVRRSSRGVFTAFAAGSSCSAAVLIRPNLLPVGVLLGAWILWRDRRDGTHNPSARAIAFAAGAAPACVVIAIVNRWLYGSAAASGYGDLGDLFSAANMTMNLRRYTTWLASTETPLALAGAAALLVPWRGVWTDARARRAARLLALVAVAVFAMYCAYIPFDDWWYLRFLLPAWPAIFIGTAALVVGACRSVLQSGSARDSGWARGIAALVIVALGAYRVATAQRLGVFPNGEGERRYATIAALVARVTEPSSVIVTTAHVGPMRYYGGRLTVRYDNLDPAWLDRALEWFARHGRRPYILLEEQELAGFRQRFAASRIGRLEMTPSLVYEAHQITGRVFLFDPVNPRPAPWQPAPIEDPQPRCPVPAASPPDYAVR